MNHYHISIFYSDEDGGYIAEVPDLGSCSAFGTTPEEALAEVRRAEKAFLAGLRATGRSAPQPRYRQRVGSADEAERPSLEEWLRGVRTNEPVMGGSSSADLVREARDEQ